jgi:signal transduction histidine kinase
MLRYAPRYTVANFPARKSQASCNPAPMEAVCRTLSEGAALTSTQPASFDGYLALLKEYEQTGGETALYRASLMSEAFIRAGLGPEDITALHFEALNTMLAAHRRPLERTTLLGRAHQFLLEVMINYGVKYKEYLDLRLQETMRRAEEELNRERAKAEEAARLEEEKLEILASIAHEMTTPLTAARGNVAIAHKLLIGGRIAEVPPMLDSTRSALGRLSRLTAHLTHVSQGELPDLEIGRVDLRPILDEAFSWTRVAAEEKQITLEARFEGDELLIDGNSDSLFTLFGNLLANALRYTPVGGAVHLEACETGEEVVVKISDTGIGMSEEVRARIFDRFYRADAAKEFAPTGLGLGLAICSQIAEMHHASIDVESAPGEGSTFTVRFRRPS